jgi:hypothetical protein
MNELRQDSDAHSLEEKKSPSLTSSAANAVQYNKVCLSLKELSRQHPSTDAIACRESMKQ